MTTPAKSALDAAVTNLRKRCYEGRKSETCHAPVADLRLVLDALKEAERRLGIQAVKRTQYFANDPFWRMEEGTEL